MTLRSRDISLTHSISRKPSEVTVPLRTEIGGINHNTYTSNAAIPSNTWICSQCTFENRGNAQRCSICSTLRYSSSTTYTSTSPLHSFIPNAIQKPAPSTSSKYFSAI